MLSPSCGFSIFWCDPGFDQIFYCMFYSLFQIVPGLDLKDLDIFPKTWSKCDSGQIATSTGSFLSRRFLTGDFLSSEIFFWFPLLIALSGQFLLNDQYGRRDATYF